MDNLKIIEKFIERVIEEIKYFFLFPTCTLRKKIDYVFDVFEESVSDFVMSKINILRRFLNCIINSIRKTISTIKRVVLNVFFEIRGFICVTLDFVSKKTNKRKRNKKIVFGSIKSKLNVVKKKHARKKSIVLKKINSLLENIGYSIIEFLDNGISYVLLSLSRIARASKNAIFKFLCYLIVPFKVIFSFVNRLVVSIKSLGNIKKREKKHRFNRVKGFKKDLAYLTNRLVENNLEIMLIFRSVISSIMYPVKVICELFRKAISLVLASLLFIVKESNKILYKTKGSFSNVSSEVLIEDKEVLSHEENVEFIYSKALSSKENYKITFSRLDGFARDFKFIINRMISNNKDKVFEFFNKPVIYFKSILSSIINGISSSINFIKDKVFDVIYKVKSIKFTRTYKVSKFKQKLGFLSVKVKSNLEYIKFYISEKKNYRKERRKRLATILGAAIKTSEGQKIATSFVAMFFCVTVLIVGATTYTWFSNLGLVNTKASGVNADKAYNYPNVSMWTFTDKTKGEGAESAWEESDSHDLENNSPVKVINSVETNEDAFITKSLHFGTIDNLVNIRQDNTVYLSFEVTPKKAGDGISIEVKEALKEEDNGNIVYPFALYNQYNEEVLDTDPIYAKIQGIIDGEEGKTNNPVFNFEYYVSNEEISDPSLFNKDDFSTISLESHEIVYTSDTTDTYYVYVKITPVLTTFARMVVHLTEIMPCVFLYDFDISYYINAN